MTASVAVRLPVAWGVKVTLNVQEALLARDAPQLSVSVKSAALAPLIVLPLIVTVEPVVFENVLGAGELAVDTGIVPKLSDVGLNETAPEMQPPSWPAKPSGMHGSAI